MLLGVFTEVTTMGNELFDPDSLEGHFKVIHVQILYFSQTKISSSSWLFGITIVFYLHANLIHYKPNLCWPYTIVFEDLPNKKPIHKIIVNSKFQK